MNYFHECQHDSLFFFQISGNNLFQASPTDQQKNTKNLTTTSPTHVKYPEQRLYFHILQNAKRFKK